jgi:hypothetical protein
LFVATNINPTNDGYLFGGAGWAAPNRGNAVVISIHSISKKDLAIILLFYVKSAKYGLI